MYEITFDGTIEKRPEEKKQRESGMILNQSVSNVIKLDTEKFVSQKPADIIGKEADMRKSVMKTWNP